VEEPPKDFRPNQQNIEGTEEAKSQEMAQEGGAVRALVECQSKFTALLNALPDLVFILDAEGRFTFYHSSGPGLYLSPTVFLGKHHNEVMPPDLCKLFAPAFERAKRGEWSEYSYALDLPDGRRWYTVRLSPWFIDQKFCGVVTVIREITDRIMLQDKMIRQGLTDSVTGIPNRLLFLDRLRHCALQLERAPDLGAAIILLDLDHFKIINDAVGPSNADLLLREVGKRLKALVRPFDTVARLGSDEFAILVEGVHDELEALRVTSRLAEVFNRPFEVEGHAVTLTASMGVAIIKPPCPDPTQMIAQAELALGRAKQQGPSSQVIYDATLHKEAMRRLEIEQDLREALERKELQAYYQPVIDLQTGRMVGLEALARWIHPTKGAISPAEFIPVAEESGLVFPLDKRICEFACRHMAQWLKQYPHLAERGFWVSVNFSPRHVARPSFPEEIAEILRVIGLAPRHLKIEVTESRMLGTFEQAQKILEALAALGTEPCLDDFGTGYSALGYLIHLPFRLLKMDISFMRNVPGGQQAEAIVQTIVGLSQHLNLSVVAEGIEREDQAEFLKQAGCQFAQGYLFAPPTPPSEVEKLLEKYSA
jgi:diguanylate cyclase (GGDEF)-like protein/PAS domain S-box-containing protein